MKILLDSGHGGSAPGAVSHEAEVKEKDLNLMVTLALGGYLKDMGHDCWYTRVTDKTVSPSERLTMIHDMQPDAFISIHTDWASSPSVSGFTIIWKDQYDKPLADAVLASMKDGIDLPSRGFLQDGSAQYNRQLAVLKDIEVPAILIELGFISNEDDLNYIQSSVDLIAKAIADGVNEWTL